MSNPKVAELQRWLNSKGACLEVDGRGGPKTRAAILEVFRNPNASKVTPQQKLVIAKSLGVSLAQLEAVTEVESRGSGWNRNGRLKALWERHYMWKRVRLAVPLLSSPKPGGYTTDVNHNGINDNWEKIADAACKWGIVAFECASFGSFQIMGAWAKDLGYEHAAEFACVLTQSEYANYEALRRFIVKNRLVQPMRRLSTFASDNEAFARGYNGPAYAKHGYHRKLAAAMARTD